MNFLRKTKSLFSVLIVSLTIAGSATAQVPYRLPASHTSQHRDLIAHQKPITTSMTRQQDVINSVKERENVAEIFNTCWNSQSVNPYGNSVAIPATKRINVADYKAPVPGRVTSPFGWRARFGRMHKGVDISLKVGDTVRAAFSGKVRLTKYDAGGYGYYVVVRHDNGMETVYGHLSRFIAKPNQRVEAGQPIALGGNTGRSTGPHLHFETRYMGIALNPSDIIDFENKTTHEEYFTFDHKKAQRALAGGTRVKASKKGYTASKKRSSKKATAAKSSKKSKTSSKKRSRR